MVLSGCANPVAQHNASRYQDAALSNSQAGNWHVARRQWAKVIGNSAASGADKQTLSVWWYEYGRALGVTCFFEKAEDALLKAYAFDKEASGEIYLSLTELARLNLDQKKYTASAKYFERSFAELDKVNAEQKAPIAYTDLLNEYAEALFNIGNNEKAKKLQGRASKIKIQNKARHSITDRTPYGKECSEPI